MPSLNSGGRNAERLGDLGDVELLDLTQHENRAEGRGELLDRLIDNLPDLTACNRAFGRYAHRAPHQHLAIVVQDGDLILLKQRSPSSRGPGMPQRIVDDDAGEPCGKRGSAREARDGSEGLQVRALHRILGIFPILQDPPRGAKQAAIVAQHHEAHCSGVAARDTRRQLEVGSVFIDQFSNQA